MGIHHEAQLTSHAPWGPGQKPGVSLQTLKRLSLISHAPISISSDGYQ
jgi:hypothetical protein